MALELGAEAGARAGCCSAVKCRNSPAAKALSLERERQPELQLPGSTEGVDACSHPDASEGGTFGGECPNEGCGFVFELTPTARVGKRMSSLASLACPDQGTPYAGIISNATGHLLGTPFYGGNAACQWWGRRIPYMARIQCEIRIGPRAQPGRWQWVRDLPGGASGLALAASFL